MVFTPRNKIYIIKSFETRDKNTSFKSLHGTFTSSIRRPYFFPELFDDCEKFGVFALWSLSSIWALYMRGIIRIRLAVNNTQEPCPHQDSN